MTDSEVDEAMEKVFPSFRYLWCEAEICFCMGCVNRNHPNLKVSKSEWEAWKKRHPPDMYPVGLG